MLGETSYIQKPRKRCFLYNEKKVISHAAFFTANLDNDCSGNGLIDVLDRRPINFSVFLI